MVLTGKMNAGEKKHLGRVSQKGDECRLMREVEGKGQDPPETTRTFLQAITVAA